MSEAIEHSQHPTTPADGSRVVGKIAKGSDTELRVSFETYKGKTRLDLRVYNRADDGSLKPTKKGVTVPLADLQAFADLVDLARRYTPPEKRP